jgi:diguanylate cyclase (GGDEF)-like protein
LLLVAALLPWSANIVYMFDIAISPGIDYTPVGFTVTGLVLSLGIYRYQLLDLIPVAREKVIENLSEAILVLDDMQRVIDYNPAAAPFFKAVPNPAAGGWIGHSAGAALLAWPVLQPHFQSRAAQHAEVRVELNADWRDFTLNVTPLFDPRGRLTGRVAALLDITPHKRAEETAVRALKIAEALQAASAALNSTLEFDRILQVILDRIAQVIALDCALVLLDDADALVISAVSCGTAPDLHLGTRIAVEGSRPENQVARERRPIRLESAAVELPAVVELPVAVELPAAEGLPAAADRGVENAPCVQGALEWPLFPQACSFLGLPVVFQDRVTGVLALYREHPEPFSEDDEQVGMSFASGVAMALENSRLYEQMKHNASTDPLTGAFNRRYFFERLEQEHARCRRFDSGMALVMLDVDFFKKLNDSFGHAFGDRILQAVIRVARSSLRGSDVLARYGGEEFVILLPNTGIEGAALVAERVRKLVEAIPLREIEGYPLERAGDPPHVTISLGISQRTSADASVDELLIRADKALYQAKQTGRNRVCIIT